MNGKFNFNLDNAPFEIAKQLQEILASELQKTGGDPETLDDLIFSFHDESYDAENGGYHPVEIHLVKIKGRWCFDYITDFTYVGCGHNAELTKEIDFDFTSGIGFQLYAGDDDLKQFSELFAVWQSNFMSYFESGVFKTKITTN